MLTTLRRRGSGTLSGDLPFRRLLNHRRKISGHENKLQVIRSRRDKTTNTNAKNNSKHRKKLPKYPQLLRCSIL